MEASKTGRGQIPNLSQDLGVDQTQELLNPDPAQDPVQVLQHQGKGLDLVKESLDQTRGQEVLVENVVEVEVKEKSQGAMLVKEAQEARRQRNYSRLVKERHPLNYSQLCQMILILKRKNRHPRTRKFQSLRKR